MSTSGKDPHVLTPNLSASRAILTGVLTIRRKDGSIKVQAPIEVFPQETHDATPAQPEDK